MDKKHTKYKGAVAGVVLFSILTWSDSLEAESAKGNESAEVVLPSFVATGEQLSDVSSLVEIHSDEDHSPGPRHYPKAIHLDASEKGEIIGMTVKYDRSISFDKIIDSFNGRLEEPIAQLDEDDIRFRLWRNEKLGVAVQLVITQDEPIPTSHILPLAEDTDSVMQRLELQQRDKQ